MRYLGDLAGRRVLEVGCGRGMTLLEFSRCGAQVSGLDYAPSALAICHSLQQQLGMPQAWLVNGDAENLPFPDDYFDLVYSVGVMEHFPDPTRAFQEQFRVVRPRGLLIVQVPQKYSFYTVAKTVLTKLGHWPYGDWETAYSAGELTAMSRRAGFAPREEYGYGSFSLALLRHFIFPRLNFDATGPIWSQARPLRWIRARTALEVGVVARKENGYG